MSCVDEVHRLQRYDVDNYLRFLGGALMVTDNRVYVQLGQPFETVDVVSVGTPQKPGWVILYKVDGEYRRCGDEKRLESKESLMALLEKMIKGDRFASLTYVHYNSGAQTIYRHQFRYGDS